MWIIPIILMHNVDCIAFQDPSFALKVNFITIHWYPRYAQIDQQNIYSENHFSCISRVLIFIFPILFTSLSLGFFFKFWIDKWQLDWISIFTFFFFSVYALRSHLNSINIHLFLIPISETQYPIEVYIVKCIASNRENQCGWAFRWIEAVIFFNWYFSNSWNCCWYW